jgi:hypothetical protein
VSQYMESFTFHGIILKGVLFSGTFTSNLVYYNYFYCLFGKRVYTRMKQAVRRSGQPSTNGNTRPEDQEKSLLHRVGQRTLKFPSRCQSANVIVWWSTKTTGRSYWGNHTPV